jgi:hypothetical protein
VVQYIREETAYMGLYTSAELITKLKALDEEMNGGVSESSIDTGQSKTSLKLSTTQLQRQYEKYKAMLQQVDPDAFKEIFGPSVLQFRSVSCPR